jgi:hypothetical protein
MPTFFLKEPKCKEQKDTLRNEIFSVIMTLGACFGRHFPKYRPHQDPVFSII